MGARQSIWLRLCLAVLFGGMLASVSGCGRDPDAAPIDQAVSEAPANADFGPLYPRVNSFLLAERPDVVSAVRDTRRWAEEHLEGFRRGSCAQTQVVSDLEFTGIFGRTTLGVTLPWMQIYIRDGRREAVDAQIDPFLWKDASLFVSTVLHEYVHSAQRVRQARDLLGTGEDCSAARSTLYSRRGTWNAGFDGLRGRPNLGSGYSPAERTLIYQWISPIERARDEVDASVTTVRWMAEHADELNAMTLGGANNWAYGVQYLQQLKLLASSNCFSPDESTYRDERRIYEVEVPSFIRELSQHEGVMRAFFKQHNLPLLHLSLENMGATATPTGRSGNNCSSAALSALPRLPIDIDITERWGQTDSAGTNNN